MLITLAAASIIIGLLVAIGWAVRRILRHTSFMASIVVQNLQDADEGDGAPVETPQHDPDDQNTRPVGFGVRLRERN